MAVKFDADTFILLWGGRLAPAKVGRVMYWATNGEGDLCGVILPESVWSGVESVLTSPTGLGAPYLALAVTGISTDTPDLRLITLDADSLYDFCYLKNAVYRLRQSPAQMKLATNKVFSHIGLADCPALTTLQRFGARPDKGEFFTFLPDKSRVELYYLIRADETPPPKLGVQVLWGLKGFGLPVVARGVDYSPAAAEKAMLQKSAVKPLPLWLRNFLQLFKRRRPRLPLKK